MRILVVEDDPISSRMVQFLLTEQGYQVDAVDNARGAQALVERYSPDLLLLDVNLPQVSGFDFYQRLREANYDMPVIFVTAKDDLEDRLQGLRMGADDYICKPFQPAELAARVEAVLRRYIKTRTEGAAIRSGSLEIDASGLAVAAPGRGRVRLTPTEMKLLLCLVRHPGTVISRDALMAQVWGTQPAGESNVVDVYIRRLRRKIERDPGNPAIILSARGVGYLYAGG